MLRTPRAGDWKSAEVGWRAVEAPVALLVG
jgi:hypothetical protein